MLLKNNKYIKKNKYILFLIIIFYVPSSFAFDYFSYMDNLNSFSTFFKQNTYNDNGLLIKSSEGYMLYKKQSKYILEYKYPNIVKFVSDGNFITTYDEDLEQAIIQSTNNKENFIYSQTQCVGLGLPPPKQLATAKAQINKNYIWDFYSQGSTQAIIQKIFKISKIKKKIENILYWI